MWRTDQTIYIGIDIGFGGALAARHDSAVLIKDMPCIPSPKGKGKALDIPAIVAWLDHFQGGDVTVLIEEPQLRPAQSSQAKPFIGAGIMLGIAHGFGFKAELVSARTWKAFYPSFRGLNRKQQKNEARRLAADLYPHRSDSFKRVKDDGRADAVLILNYAKNSGGT